MFSTDIRDLHKRSFLEFLLLCLDYEAGVLEDSHREQTENQHKTWHHCAAVIPEERQVESWETNVYFNLSNASFLL